MFNVSKYTSHVKEVPSSYDLDLKPTDFDPEEVDEYESCKGVIKNVKYRILIYKESAGNKI